MQRVLLQYITALSPVSLHTICPALGLFCKKSPRVASKTLLQSMQCVWGTCVGYLWLFCLVRSSFAQFVTCMEVLGRMYSI